MADCTFSMLAGPNDVGFVEDTLRHLLKACAFPFLEILLLIDDLPKRRQDQSAWRRLLGLAEDLERDGTITRHIALSAVRTRMEMLGPKHFGAVPPRTRDHRGVPLLGWITGLEEARTDFLVHFDSDILVFQAPGRSWLREGMRLIAENDRVMFVAPRPGPPTTDGHLLGQRVPPTLDAAGNFWFKTFSSRRYLVNRHRFEALLPTPFGYISEAKRRLMKIGIGNGLLTWEDGVSLALEHSAYSRVHLADPAAWAVHCTDHGPEWLGARRDIIARVERGEYPEAQAGYYDLLIPAWRSMA